MKIVTFNVNFPKFRITEKKKNEAFRSINLVETCKTNYLNADLVLRSDPE